MLDALPLSKATQFLRSFSGQVAMSIAVSAGVAGVLAVPDFLLRRAEAPAVEAPATVEAGIEIAGTDARLPPYAAGGKIDERLGEASEEEAASQARRAGLILPATLAMPMSASWPKAARFELEPAVRTAAEPRMQAASIEVPAPKRPLAVAERTKLAVQAAPLQIAPPAAAFAPQTAEAEVPPAPAGLLSRVVVRPVVRVSEAVSGAAGAVGTAGSWTVSQMAGLLPRW